MRAILATNNNLVPTPTPVPLDGGVTAITAGAEFTCAVLAGGGADCWGQNASGQLGNGSDAGANTPLPVAVLLSGATRISAGTNHACALIDGGTVDCWGDNTYGQLGNEDVAPQPRPAQVSGLTGVTALACGGFHTCALLGDGGVECWGYNSMGQVGNGAALQRPLPVPVR